MQSFTKAATRAARDAGTLQRNKFRSIFQIREKAPANLVTEIDLQSEAIILEVLRREFPGIPALTEETTNSCSDHEPARWIIDPLDGTTNYAHGYPFFGVSIALERNGVVDLGVVYLPIFDELYRAVRGEGAYLNGEPIRVSTTDTLSRSLLGSGFPYDAWTSSRDNNHEWAAMVKKVVSMRCDGAAALDLCLVAAGVLDGYWELDLEAWDMAAGALIVEEAGGMVSLVDGRPFDMFSRSILASNKLLHPVLVEDLNVRV